MWNLFTWICDYDSRWHPFTPASDLFSMHSFAIFFICWFGCGRCFCFPEDLSQDPNINFVHHLYCSTFVICVTLSPTLFFIPFYFLKKKNEDMIKIIFSLFWRWVFQILYIYFVLLLTEYNDEISLWALFMLPVKRVPHILLLLPLKTTYCMIPVSLSLLKPRITKDIFVQFTSCRFKSPSSC